MLVSYIKTSGRNIVRNKLFSSINIVGLSISMSVGLIMISMLWDLFSYDRFHENHDRIYRIISKYQFLDHKDNSFMATTSLKAAKAIKEEFSGIEDVAIFGWAFNGDVSYNDKTIPLSGFWANEAVFKVFSFELLQGNPATALKQPFAIVLTEKSAKKMFGDVDALGKTINLKDKQYTITGIVKDVPTFSHIKFDMLTSLSTREVLEKNNKHEMAWNNIWSTWAYVLMPPRADLNTFQQELNKLSEREDKTIKHTHIQLALQPLTNIMAGENLNNQIGTTIGSTVVWILGSLSFIVILSACFNYTNLSIARSLRRSREVGIRKSIGALKSHVVSQFIVESVFISLLALLVAFGLFLVIRPHFISLESSLQMLKLQLTPALVLLFILFAIMVGVLAGLFPALFFSRINAVQVLKNLGSVPVLKGLTLRKVLIVFQYSLSIIAITATLIIYKQYKHFISFDLGFSTANILNISLKDNKAELLIKELSELPEVKGISQSLLVTSVGNYWGVHMKNPNNPTDSAGVYYNSVDENYLPLHNHELIAGNNFTANTQDSIETEVIVNQHVLKRFNIAEQNPAKAIGEVVKVDGKDLRIIGVIKNFEYGKVNNNSGKEVIIRYLKEKPRHLNVKILSADWPATYAELEAIWKKIDPVHPFEAKFYDDQIEEAFNGLKAAMKLGGFLAVLVICIASVGLLGMVIFTTETRLKEISIRKVMGASERGLLYLLSKSFLTLLLIAASIALPLIYFFFQQVLFPEIANHAPLNLSELFVGVIAVLLLALVIIGTQTFKVARTNPAEILKSE
ncbi:ABC transporter permease [Fulvivirgaceae bacterium PWU20]|uniref:ABC transporter permease n=2 Tax=Chryseosolibacter indicus TaxID=2782351 RepID=A0ABS5VMS7_9BACT|nr:ABC transporter permease [Chryseosolibacter indicus]